MPAILTQVAAGGSLSGRFFSAYTGAYGEVLSNSASLFVLVKLVFDKCLNRVHGGFGLRPFGDDLH